MKKLFKVIIDVCGITIVFLFLLIYFMAQMGLPTEGMLKHCPQWLKIILGSFLCFFLVMEIYFWVQGKLNSKK